MWLVKARQGDHPTPIKLLDLGPSTRLPHPPDRPAPGALVPALNPLPSFPTFTRSARSTRERSVAQGLPGRRPAGRPRRIHPAVAYQPGWAVFAAGGGGAENPAGVRSFSARRPVFQAHPWTAKKGPSLPIACRP